MFPNNKAEPPPPARRFGFLDLGNIPDSLFLEPMTEDELAEWE